ncbi:hypothetical protein L3X38_012097 [Prunus dulcis]|uniref:Retrovirus-related Pol polyprotein from transposon TNT 1-94 n=1 Tax=Prunus dulcis TaxID=3755 RepID=A0AAD4WIT6_PRUDU|nr:hypothetical protein L3X38_012097 [Prunus dulcis]
MFVGKFPSNKLFMKEELLNIQLEDAKNITDTEDEALMLLTSLRLSYDHLQKMLIIGKSTLNFEEVVQDLVHHGLAQNFGDSSQDGGLVT